MRLVWRCSAADGSAFPGPESPRSDSVERHVEAECCHPAEEERQREAKRAEPEQQWCVHGERHGDEHPDECGPETVYDIEPGNRPRLSHTHTDTTDFDSFFTTLPSCSFLFHVTSAGHQPESTGSSILLPSSGPFVSTPARKPRRATLPRLVAVLAASLVWRDSSVVSLLHARSQALSRERRRESSRRSPLSVPSASTAPHASPASCDAHSVALLVPRAAGSRPRYARHAHGSLCSPFAVAVLTRSRSLRTAHRSPAARRR